MPNSSAEANLKRLIRMCLQSGGSGMPRRAADREILFSSLVVMLEADRAYTQSEFDEKIYDWLTRVARAIRTDYVTVRRYLVDEGYVRRDRAGRCYRVNHERLADVGFPDDGDFDPAAAIKLALRERKRRKRAQLRHTPYGPLSPPRRCVFLTTENLEGFITDDELTGKILSDLGWEVDMVPWRRDCDWRRYHAVVIRSTWDYQRDPELFVRRLEDIEFSGGHLLNPMSIVRDNIRKTYLRELQTRGVATVPTWYGTGRPSAATVRERASAFETSRVVIKPVIGASADHTYVLDGANLSELPAEVLESYRDREFMLQPFLPQVQEEGEYSLMYFEGDFSHAVLKTPESGDFRSQEEHGGIIKAVRPDAFMLRQGQEVIDGIDPVPLYARVDYVRTGAEEAVLIELELVEPALYLSFDDEAPRRFAEAIGERISEWERAMVGLIV